MKKLFKNKFFFLIPILIIIFITSKLLTSKNDEGESNYVYKTINKPKNIIYMISDGMGYNHMLATDYYQKGSTNLQQYQSFPVKYAMSHYPALTGSYPGALITNAGYSPKGMWSNFNYPLTDFTESAAAATAMSTGVKTYNNSICMDVNYQRLLNLTDLTKSMNKSAGVISSVEFTHATPAGFVAHNLTRNNYAQIAFEMLLGSRLDVIMGCGNPDYNNSGATGHNTYKYVGDSLCWLGLQAGNSIFYVNGVPDTVEDCNGDGTRDPWLLIQDRSQFQNLMTGNTPIRVLGVPKVFETLQQSRAGDVNANPYVVPLTTTVPTLVEMTRGALNVLDNNTNGFFLMIEGGAIDWASHGNQKGRLIEEQIDFNNAVDAVIQWVNTNSNWNETLVIVTADHETGYLWGPGSGAPSTFNPIINNGQNNLPGMSYYSLEHTNSLVPFFAKGAASHMFNLFADEYDSLRGRYIQNSEIAQGIKALWDANYGVVSVGFIGVEVPRDYTLDQNYPNPFNPTTTISFNLRKTANVSLKVYDITGKLVKTLVNNEKIQVGVKSIKMNASDLSSGIYFYSLDVDNTRIDSKKMVLIK
jgi:alkaline phosphatase